MQNKIRKESRKNRKKNWNRRSDNGTWIDLGSVVTTFHIPRRIANSI